MYIGTPGIRGLPQTTYFLLLPSSICCFYTRGLVISITRLFSSCPNHINYGKLMVSCESCKIYQGLFSCPSCWRYPRDIVDFLLMATFGGWELEAGFELYNRLSANRGRTQSLS